MKSNQAANPLTTVLRMIKFEHTLFALPFAFLGMILAAGGLPSWRTVGWIVVAMVGARSAAMGFNRLVDRRLDAANPRTADRALPAGRVSVRFVILFVVASIVVFLLASWRLNPLTLILAPGVLVVLLGYSYTKRLTAGSHLVLGLALGLAPLGAWVAVRGEFARPPFLLTAVVLLWVAGFDVLYALQDREHDRSVGLHSIPVRFGETAALWTSALFHLGMLGLLVWLPWVYAGLGWIYWLGVAGCAALLGFQHAIVRPGDLERLDAAFFRANGLLAVWLLATTAIDLWL